MPSLTEEIAASAARWVVEEGMDYAAAKQRALKACGVARAALPDNAMLEREVRAYINTFCADSQAQELLVLRQLAVQWMERLAPFRPHLCGAVWRGTATRQSQLVLQLFCDDPKSAEIALLDQGLRFDVGQVRGFTGRWVDALTLWVPCAAWQELLPLQLSMYDHDDLRGALKPDQDGQTARGNLAALQALLRQAEQA